MFCHINSVPTTQQSCLINGDIKNNIREHVHGVVMATRIPNYPVALLIYAFGNDGHVGEKKPKSIFFQFFVTVDKMCGL